MSVEEACIKSSGEGRVRRTSTEKETASKEEEGLFPNVLGYEDVKKELALIRSWYLDKSKVNDPLLSMPKGLLFYGPFGCGKTLFMRELASSFKAPTFTLKGPGSEGYSESIDMMFDEAEKNPFSIIVIDELDPVTENPSDQRTLLTRMDGFDKSTKSKVLVLATSNNRKRIPPALLRSGRIDRKIYIDYPNEDERVLLFKKFFEMYGLNGEGVDYETLMNETDRLSGSDIKSIVNDAKLRLGTTITTEGIYESYERVVLENYYIAKPNKTMRCAIHEAGHAIMSLLYDKNYRFEFMSMEENGNGMTTAPRRKGGAFDLESRIELIDIGLAGMEAEKLVYHALPIGGASDIQRLREMAYELIQEDGIKGFSYVSELFEANNNNYDISDKKIRRIERQVTRLLNKERRKTRKLLKEHKTDVMKVANAFYTKEHLTRNEVTSLGLSFVKGQAESKECLQTSIRGYASKRRPGDGLIDGDDGYPKE